MSEEKEIGQTLVQNEEDNKITAVYQYLSKTLTGDYLQAKLKKDSKTNKVRLVIGRYSKRKPTEFKSRTKSTNFRDKYMCGLELKSEELKNLLNFLQNSQDFLNSFSGEKSIYHKLDVSEKEILNIFKKNLIVFNNVINEVDLQSLEYAKNQYDLKLLNILEYENKLNNPNLSEENWQDFFEKNIHFLQISIPNFIKYLHGKPFIGGKMIDNKGGNSSDFAFLDSTDSIAFIEIKKPQTNLFKINKNDKVVEYRNNTFVPSDELTGGISQVLTQRHIYYSEESVNRNKKVFYNSPCYLIIGKISDLTVEQKQNFSLFRNSLVNVNVITFDEILSRIKIFIETIKKSNEDLINPVENKFNDNVLDM